MTDQAEMSSEATRARGENSRVPGYVLLERLGGGGYGEVYRARDTSKSSPAVAVKIITPHPFIADADPEKRFAREEEAVRQLGHKGIVRYVSSGWTNDNPALPFLAMELITGSDLFAWAKDQPFPERINAMIEVLDAIAYAHSMDVLHRDIKPSNVMVRASDSQPVLVDFGLAYVFEGLSSTDLTSRYVGSAGYIPDEVLAKPRMRTPLHDVYSCAVTAYEICAGRQPIPRTYGPLSAVDPALSGLDPLIKKGLAPAPERYQNAKSFADDLRAWRERAVMRSKAGPNPLADTFRANLIRRQRDSDEQKRREADRKALLGEIWADANGLILEAARLAFEDFHSQLADLLPGSKVVEPVGADKAAPGLTSVMIRYSDGKGTRVVLAHSTSHAIDKPGAGGGVMVSSEGRTLSLASHLSPCWVICREPSERELTSPEGIIAVDESRVLHVKPLTVWGPDGMGTIPRTLAPLRSLKDVRDYVMKALGAALMLDGRI